MCLFILRDKKMVAHLNFFKSQIYYSFMKSFKHICLSRKTYIEFEFIRNEIKLNLKYETSFDKAQNEVL